MKKKGLRRKSYRIKGENKRLKKGRVSKLKILKVFAILIFVVSVLWGIHSFWKTLMASPNLTIKNLRVLGDYPDREEIKDGFNRHCLEKYNSKQPNILEVDLDDLRKYLETFPKVDEVKIRRQFPETIFIEVKRRIPIALIPSGANILGCDEHQVFEIDLPSKYDLPFITGLKEAQRDKIRGATKIIFEMRNTTPSLLPMISEINASDSQNLFAYTTEGTRIYFGNVNNYNLEERLTKLKDILDYSERVHLMAEYVDLRFNRIVIKPGG